MKSRPQFRVAAAAEKDVALILEFSRALAAYEKVPKQVTATEANVRAALFGPRPYAEAVIGYADDEPAGMAVFFSTYSTFLGRPGLYVEDIIVKEKWRGGGLGRTLMAHVAALAVERGCGRLEWAVLNWNEPAIRFYRNLGARAMDQWTAYRLAGNELERLAAAGQSCE